MGLENVIKSAGSKIFKHLFVSKNCMAHLCYAQEEYTNYHPLLRESTKTTKKQVLRQVRVSTVKCVLHQHELRGYWH